jgi:hypothetical protein
MRDLQINYVNCIDGPIAQLVEQRIENPRVTGSIPVRATNQNKAHSDVGFFSFIVHFNFKPLCRINLVLYLTKLMSNLYLKLFYTHPGTAKLSRFAR